MNREQLLEYDWDYLLTFFPPPDELDRTAFEMGALRRKRNIKSASTLLRLAFAYGFMGMSLRETAAWAEVADIASVSDVALMKRLRSASDWLGYLLSYKLAERASPPSVRLNKKRLRLVDATTVSKPGSTGTDWRIHMGFCLQSLAIDFVKLTDNSIGETLLRFPVTPDDIIIGDRGYAHRKGFQKVVASNADFIIRLNWQNVPLLDETGKKFDLLGYLRSLPDAQVNDVDVTIKPLAHNASPIKSRLVAVRKSEAAAAEARQKVMKSRSKKGRSIDPRTLEAAGYIFVLTSLSQDSIRADAVLDLYRFRWQIELAFKRMKSLMSLGELPVRDPPLARSYLYTKLLGALLIEDFTQEFLCFSPWGFRMYPNSFPLAHSKSIG